MCSLPPPVATTAHSLWLLYGHRQFYTLPCVFYFLSLSLSLSLSLFLSLSLSLSLSAIPHVLYTHSIVTMYTAWLQYSSLSIEFEGLHDYFSWLGSPLDVTFSSLKTCLNFALSRNGKGTNIDPEYVEVGDRKIVTFSIPMVTEDYSNATMTVQGEIGGSLYYKNFTVFTQGTSWHHNCMPVQYTTNECIFYVVMFRSVHCLHSIPPCFVTTHVHVCLLVYCTCTRSA